MTEGDGVPLDACRSVAADPAVSGRLMVRR
jgi:hypothetical protein